MTFTLRPVRPESDAGTLHSWFTQDYAAFWDMLHAGVEEVRREHKEIDASPHHDAFLGLDDGRPAFLLEQYDPQHSPIAGLYKAGNSDVGMHLLVAPPEVPEPGFTRRVIAAALDHLFADPSVERVVVEPDIRNHKIQALNAAAGFRPAGTIALPDKEALLSICTRDDYAAARPNLQKHPREQSV